MLDRLQMSTFKIQYDKTITTCPNVATSDVIENLMIEREVRSSEKKNDDYSRSSGGVVLWTMLVIWKLAVYFHGYDALQQL